MKKNNFMLERISTLSLLALFLLSSCKSQKAKTPVIDSLQEKETNIVAPNFNYSVEVPKNWVSLDTVMQDGMKIRFLIPPTELRSDYPSANILVAHMGDQAIDEFTSDNINYLKTNMPGILILETGTIDTKTYNGRWFTYTKSQNGVTRDMINYIIPLNGFAYMITCSSNKGTIVKYRLTFDGIAKSFKG